MSGVTVLAAVWEVCKDRLDPATAQETDTTFLLLVSFLEERVKLTICETALLAIAEYVSCQSYLLCFVLRSVASLPPSLTPITCSTSTQPALSPLTSISDPDTNRIPLLCGYGPGRVRL